MATVLQAVEDFLFRDFPSRTTFTTNYHGMDSQQRTVEAMDKRYKGYQKICLYGLGCALGGAATGVLSNLQDKHPEWIFWGSIYFVVSIVLILNGLTAAMFSSSTPLALSTAGLGAWTAYIYMLATFHLASLQFHSNVIHCAYSMIGSSIAVTFHWSYGSQDPLILLILCRIILWLLVITLYGIFILIPWGIFKLFKLVAWTFGLVISALHGLVRKDGNSSKRLLAKNKAHNTKTEIPAITILELRWFKLSYQEMVGDREQPYIWILVLLVHRE